MLWVSFIRCNDWPPLCFTVIIKDRPQYRIIIKIFFVVVNRIKEYIIYYIPLSQKLKVAAPRMSGKPRAGAVLSVLKMPHAGKQHGNARFVGGFYGISVAYRTARLDNSRNSGFFGGFDAVGEREESI